METQLATKQMNMSGNTPVKEEKRRIDFLDYLKALCVILVVVTHYDWADKDSYIFTMFINMAVPVFMIISGYNFAMSNKKKTNGHFKSMYSLRMILPKLERFLVPFTLICIIEIIILMIENKNINLPRIFLLGAYGPGSYYVPLMIQLLVLFPLIYVLIEKTATWGLLITGILNLLFEMGVQITGMSKYCYRLLLGRYLLLIALGCFLYLHPEKRIRKWQLLAMLAIGMGYIIIVLDNGANPLIFDYWTPTAMPIAFYIFPITVILFRKLFHSHIPGVVGQALSEIGKASYHIFLVQMVYYHFELGGILMNQKWFIAVPYNLVITILLGTALFNLDKHFAKKVSLHKLLLSKLPKYNIV